MPASGAINQYSGTKLDCEDLTAPTITFAPANPQTGRWYNTNQRVDWSISDGGSGVRGFRQAWDDAPYSAEYAGANGWLYLADAGEGQHTAKVRAWDNAGNERSAEVGWFGYDISKPGGHLTNPLDGSATNTPSWTLKASPSDGLSGVKEVAFHVRYDGTWHPLCVKTSAPFECAWSLPGGVPDQNITFTIHVVDNAGNTALDPGGYRVVTVDRQAPTGSVVLNHGWASADGLAMPLSLTADGTGSAVREVQFSPNGTTWSEANWQPMNSSIWAVLSGEHGGTATAYVQYKDAAGNRSATISGSIPLDFYPARPQSANYRIQKDVMAISGGAHQSANYQLNSTLGQAVSSGGASSASYASTWGYWAQSISAAIKRVFIPLIQK